MRDDKFYLGLDTATVTGIAVLLPGYRAAVASVKGNPIQQLGVIGPLIIALMKDFPQINISMEKQHNFFNADTARSLVERYGFIKWTLTGSGFVVNEVSPKPARKLLEVNSKEECFRKFCNYYKGTALTSDHTDALALCIFSAHQEGYPMDWKRLVIADIEIEVVGK